ncbi:MAG: TIM barrel protein, partial [Atribacterota bacterium]
MFDILTVSTNTYHTFHLDQAMNGISKAGFRYLELSCVSGWTEHFPFKNYPPADVENLLKKCQNYGLTISSVSGHSDLAKKEGYENLKKAVDLAHEVGAKIVNTGTVEKEADVAFLLRSLPGLGDYAQKKNCKIGLEIHGDVLKNG